MTTPLVRFLLFILLSTPLLQATPYASSLTNTGSSIGFRLNQAADTVLIISNGGTTTNDLGALPAGSHVAQLTIAGAYELQVQHLAGLGYLVGSAIQTSDDANPALQFFSPRGVALNTDPASPWFGRVYVANSRSGMVQDRTVGDGIYLLNSDLSDALGQGDTARTGGIGWNVFSSFSPWRIEVGQDGRPYISDWSDARGGIYVTDPDVTSASGTNVLIGIGSPFGGADPSNTHGVIQSSVLAFGSLATGDLALYALEGSDLGENPVSVNQVRRWNVGSGPLPSGAIPANQTDDALIPFEFVSVDLDLGANGLFYLAQRVERPTFDPSILVADPAVDLVGGGLFGDEPNGRADVVWNSLHTSTNLAGDVFADDFLYDSQALKLFKNLLAVLRNDSKTWIIPLDAQGLPLLEDRLLIDTGNLSTGRDLAFDAAGNLYVLSDGSQRLRVFRPGLSSVATTTSTGNFTVTNFPPPQAFVELRGVDLKLYERYPADSATLTFSRVGGNLANPLTINFALAGTANPGVHFQPVGNSITIPANQLQADLVLTGIDNSSFDGDKTLTITIAPGGYTVSPTANSATVTVRDDELPSGTEIFADDFDLDTSAAYHVNTTADARATFLHDYSFDGIPSAPNSSGGSTLGVKFEANVTSQTANAISISPIGQTFSNDYILQCDMWINVVGPLPNGGPGSTEFFTAGIGLAEDTTPVWPGNPSSSGAWFAVNGEGGATEDFRAYVDDTLQLPASGQYETSSLSDADPYYHLAFPGGQTPPPLQQSLYPASQTGLGDPGSVGFAWRNFQIAKIGSRITWKLDDLIIAIFDTNSAPVSTVGNIFVGYMDLFTSLAGNPAVSFGLVDNLRVLVPVVSDLEIVSVEVVGASVIITFQGNASDTINSFTLLGSPAVQGPYSTETGAGFSELAPTGSGRFQASVPAAGPMRFYQLERNP